MTHLAPCNHCHRRDGCPIKAKTLQSLRGLNITTAKLRCAIPRQDFPVGAVVQVKAFEMVETGLASGPEFVKSNITRRGVVASWHMGKATIILDKDQEIEKMHEDGSIGYLKVETDRLTRIDTPLVELCKCGLSQARCENSDYPSVRNGEWTCGEQARDLVDWP